MKPIDPSLIRKPFGVCSLSIRTFMLQPFSAHSSPLFGLPPPRIALLCGNPPTFAFRAGFPSSSSEFPGFYLLYCPRMFFFLSRSPRVLLSKTKFSPRLTPDGRSRTGAPFFSLILFYPVPFFLHAPLAPRPDETYSETPSWHAHRILFFSEASFL